MNKHLSKKRFLSEDYSCIHIMIYPINKDPNFNYVKHLLWPCYTPSIKFLSELTMMYWWLWKLFVIYIPPGCLYWGKGTALLYCGLHLPWRFYWCSSNLFNNSVGIFAASLWWSISRPGPVEDGHITWVLDYWYNPNVGQSGNYTLMGIGIANCTQNNIKGCWGG